MLDKAAPKGNHRPMRLATLVAIATVAVLSPRTARAQSLVPLELYWNASRHDNLTTATAEGRQSAARAGYGLVRNEGCVLPTSQPGTVPLYLYWSATRGDNLTATTTFGGSKGTPNPGGYTLVRVEGYVYTEAGKSMVPLNLFYNSQRHDHLTTATTAGADAARQAGYDLIGIQGYVMPASSCQ